MATVTIALMACSGGSSLTGSETGARGADDSVPRDTVRDHDTSDRTGETGATGDTSVSVTSPTATSDTRATALATGDTSAGTSYGTGVTGDSATTTAATGDTGPLCDAIFGPNCYVEDGLCFAVDITRSDTITDVGMDFLVDQTLSGCGSVLVSTCAGGEIVIGYYPFLAETPEIDVFDPNTRGWLAGYIIEDEEYKLCGNKLWVGDPALFECGRDSLQWVQTQASSCRYHPQAASGECLVLDPTCVRDEVKR